MSDLPPIDSFSGEYRFLSNFWFTPELEIDGVSYRTAEHAYQASKCMDPREAAMVRAAPTPGEAKRAGRSVQMRPDWNDVRIDVMTSVVWHKFQASDLRACLVATAPRELIEGNNWGDTFWGVCNDVGANQLGRILMRMRQLILSEHVRNM